MYGLLVFFSLIPLLCVGVQFGFMGIFGALAVYAALDTKCATWVYAYGVCAVMYILVT
jgi:hypothetical protein